MSNTVQMTEIKRQDLLDMSGLTDKLEKNDLIFLTNRDELDAVIARPGSLAEAMKDCTNKTAVALRERLKQKNIRITDSDRAMLRVIHNLGTPRLTEIADGVGKSMSNIHRRVQTLVERGVIERDENGPTYSLTEEGKKAIA